MADVHTTIAVTLVAADAKAPAQAASIECSSAAGQVGVTFTIDGKSITTLALTPEDVMVLAQTLTRCAAEARQKAAPPE